MGNDGANNRLGSGGGGEKERRGNGLGKKGGKIKTRDEYVKLVDKEGKKHNLIDKEDR